jgi:hypothetical protein
MMTASLGDTDALVLDEVAEVAVLLLADRGLQADGLLGDLAGPCGPCSTGISMLSAISSTVGSRPSSCTSMREVRSELVDGLDHVDRDADGPRLVGDGAGDGLADPPGGVGRELVPTAVLELVHRLHQADVALLDQVQELKPAVGVLLGDGDHQPEVGLDQLLLGTGRC